MLDRRQQQRNVLFLLPFNDRRRVLACGCEMRTVIGTGDLDQPFGAAAYGADGLMKGGAGPPPFALMADGAGHWALKLRTDPFFRHQWSDM